MTYTVALIQNQSEMSHYGYADARPLIKEIGYIPILYTAQNIEKLSSELKKLKFDAIIFASNALNDKTIRSSVLSSDFENAFEYFIKNGKGCLILHQLRMAQQETLFDFLPKSLKSVLPKARPPNEKASEGNLFLTPLAKNHPCFVYPNNVNLLDVKKQCLNFRSLKGLYWHYWDNINESEWNILTYDYDTNRKFRPLIISSKESNNFRIVLSALTLDWQKQRPLLHNILTYVVEGRHNTAILKDSRYISTGFEYFIESLKSQKYPFRMYEIYQNLDELRRNIENGIHKIIILGPFASERKDSDLFLLLKRNVNNGKIKLINISHKETDLKQFYIAGRERYALRILHEIELNIQRELYHGYIDGSFWSTVESLQILDDLSHYVYSKYDFQAVKKVIELSNVHDRDGSYDEVFGVTCALLWLRAKYLGLNDKNTIRTLKWVRNNLSNFEDREKALAYYTLIKIGTATRGEKQNLENLLLGLQNRIEYLTDMDLIVYLKAAVLIKAKDLLISIIRRLKNLQEDGHWIDLATTATAITAILDAMQILNHSYQDAYVKFKSEFEQMIFKAVIYIQESMTKRIYFKEDMYPWDNKASTSLKCIHAWLKFEDLIDLPIYELIEALKSYSYIENKKVFIKTSLSILEELKNENTKLNKKINNLSAKIKQLNKTEEMNRYLLVLVLSLFYFIISIVVYSSLTGLDWIIFDILRGTFITNWPFHLGFLSLTIAIIKLIIFERKRHEQ